MKRIAITYKGAIGYARDLAGSVAEWLQGQSIETSILPDAGSARRDPARPELDRDQLEGSDLLVVLGGDGSILRAAHAAASLSVPILGINLGRVGFLTEADPEDWSLVLGRVLSGDYWIEDRMMLQTRALRDGKTLADAEALNDVVVGRGARAQVVHLQTEVDGGSLANYVADGLIVASPTGSTAYALAAGGPILPPQLRNILLVPVAPHLSMARPVVLSEGVQVRIVVGPGRPAVLTVDGTVQSTLGGGDEVLVAASPNVARFARVQEQNYFYKTLVARLVPRH